MRTAERVEYAHSILKNFGIDIVTCGACAKVAFTGATNVVHTPTCALSTEQNIRQSWLSMLALDRWVSENTTRSWRIEFVPGNMYGGGYFCVLCDDDGSPIERRFRGETPEEARGIAAAEALYEGGPDVD